MVRTYKKKTNAGEWSQEKMTEAVNKVQNKVLTLRKAAEIFEVPYTSLQRRVNLSRGVIKRRGGQPVLDEEAEQKIADRLLHLASRGFGITPKAVRKYAFEFAEKQNIQHKFNRSAGMAGQDWFHRFMRRNKKLTIRKPEGLSRARIDGMKKEKVAEFFNTLETIVDNNNLRGRPECIYNVDETGMPLSNRPPNIIAQKGAKDVVSMTTVERGENVTVLACMNAAGQYIPPFVLFKGVRKRDDFLLGMPPGTEVAMTEKGWVTEEAFKLWLQHFNRYRTPGKVILILDGHASHTSYSVVDLCDSFEIELVLLPPHTSHALQPLDLSFFKPLKTYYHQQATAWQHSHPNRGITKVAFGALFQRAWNQAATVGNATKGFEKTGIFPLNANAIPDHKFIGDQKSDIVESLVQTPDTQPVVDPVSSASSRQSDKAQSSTCADEERKKMKNKATPGIKIKSSSTKQRECQVPQVQSKSFQQVQPQDQSSSVEQVQSKIMVQVQATNTKPLDNIVPFTSSQQAHEAQPPTCAEIIKEILPSPLKSPIPSKKIRKVSKPVLHLTSPQSKTALLEKETKKKFKVDNKIKENKEKAVGKENTLKKMKNKAKPAIKIKSPSAKQREWHCIYCSEIFVHPPTEDWIQCNACEEWCHEKCADMGGERGPYICELCAHN
ncbi:uncharacterized protein LOC123659815 [Melitaea cinxia]|uniref:uncharacterized protein LOC123659815 n=1 Tax=Melitaea cinxia TaxID=113334 RepID=UPI001E2749DD|nr:uncharacterized protein LOC123659815 [Melitaea cinxia]